MLQDESKMNSSWGKWCGHPRPVPRGGTWRGQQPGPIPHSLLSLGQQPSQKRTQGRDQTSSLCPDPTPTRNFFDHNRQNLPHALTILTPLRVSSNRQNYTFVSQHLENIHPPLCHSLFWYHPDTRCPQRHPTPYWYTFVPRSPPASPHSSFLPCSRHCCRSLEYTRGDMNGHATRPGWGLGFHR